jgi:hypothetical protein
MEKMVGRFWGGSGEVDRGGSGVVRIMAKKDVRMWIKCMLPSCLIFKLKHSQENHAVGY